MIKRIAALASLTLIIAFCSGLAVYRANGCTRLMDNAAVAAGRLSFINGSADAAPSEAPTEAKKPQRPLANGDKEPTPTTQKTENTTHTGESYPVVETMVNNGNMTYDNISIRNTTGFELDPEALLGSDLPFELEDSRSVQVLVYHTHSCESYLEDDSGVYYDDFYPRSTDPEKGVMAVGEALVNTLKERGIGAVHDTTLHDYPSYEGSYARSWETISEYREKYPTIKVTVDLHRDAMTSQDGVKYKPTFEHEGSKAAQIMIMTGYDTGGGFDFWDENLIFAMHLQKQCEDMFPGMTRPLSFGEFTYNMNFNNGSLLIEVGTDGNTVEEARRSGGYIGEALADLLTDSYQ